jgi:hypothetical protein
MKQIHELEDIMKTCGSQNEQIWLGYREIRNLGGQSNAASAALYKETLISATRIDNGVYAA